MPAVTSSSAVKGLSWPRKNQKKLAPEKATTSKAAGQRSPCWRIIAASASRPALIHTIAATGYGSSESGLATSSTCRG